MPDIFDAVSSGAAPAGDIFDQVAGPSRGPTATAAPMAMTPIQAAMGQFARAVNPPGVPSEKGLFDPIAPIPLLPPVEKAPPTAFEQVLARSGAVMPTAVGSIFGEPAAVQATRSVANIPIGLARFATSLGGLGSLAAAPFAPTAVATAFLGSTVYDLGKELKITAHDWDKMTVPQRVDAVVNIGGTTAMAATMAKLPYEKAQAFYSKMREPGYGQRLAKFEEPAPTVPPVQPVPVAPPQPPPPAPVVQAAPPAPPVSVPTAPAPPVSIQQVLQQPGPVSFETAAKLLEKGPSNAKGIREDAGQVPPTGNVPQGGTGESRPNLEQQAQGQPVGGPRPPVSALRQEVEGQKDLLHSFRAVGQLVRDPRLPESAQARLRAQASEVGKMLAGGASKEQVEAGIAGIREDHGKMLQLAEELGPQEALAPKTPVPPPTPPTEKTVAATAATISKPDVPMLDAKKEIERRLKAMRELPPKEGPLPEIGDTLAPSARIILRDPERLKMDVADADKPLDAGQLVGRLMNQVPAPERAILEAAGIRKAFPAGRKASAAEVDKWVEGNMPRVEVRKKGEGTWSAKQKEHAQLQHWYDSLQYGIQSKFRDWLSHRGYLSEKLLEDIFDSPDELVKAKRYAQLQRDPAASIIDDEAANWSSIAPKPESEMPGYVEGAVVVPMTKETQALARQDITGQVYPGERPDVLFPSTHSFPPNTLGFFRGYMETRPDGGKTFHVVEVQTDVAVEIRDGVFGVSGHPELGEFSAKKDAIKAAEKIHPLTQQWERLPLKAAIDHAQKEGADRIAVSDAETAGMSEGVDRTGRWAQDYEKGFRLHYDTILPRLLEEMTGQKGKAVEFGEHKMAVEANPIPTAVERGLPNRVPRKDLIFRTPTGEPKTTVTAHEFPIEDVAAAPYALTGKQLKGPTQAPAGTVRGQASLDRLGYRPGVTAREMLSKMAAQPEDLGRINAALAGFLTENFEPVLRMAEVKLGSGRSPSGRENYDPIDHTLNLAHETSVNPLPFRLLEEATHAATYWQFEHPRTATQIRAAEAIQRIMAESEKRLSESDRAAIGKQEWGLPYRHKDIGEFLAGLVSDPELRQHLNSFRVEEGTAWERFVTAVKNLLGIKPGTALDQAFDRLIEVGAERGHIDAARAEFKLDPLSAPARAPGGVIEDATRGEAFKAALDSLRGVSFPKHSNADIGVANKLAEYASARIAAPEVAHWMATDVLGPHYKDKVFDRLLGSVLVEDRLRSVRKGFEDLAAVETDPTKKAEYEDSARAVTSVIGKPGSPVKSEAHYQHLLADPEMKAAIARHKDTVQPYAQRMHQELGGEVARPGEDTEAFVNLRAIFDADDVESARSMIFGNRHAELTNPLRRGSVFSKHTKGTAPMYELSYRTLAERMIRGNYEQSALRAYTQDLVSKNLAVEEKPGVRPPTTMAGKPTRKITVEIRGAGPGMTKWKNLWVREDLYPEFRQALDVDESVRWPLIQPLLHAITSLQVLGPTDIAWHSVNMVGTISGLQGASKSVMYDLLRKGTPVGFFDGVGRIAYNSLKAMMDHPETQKAIAEISRIGAGRAKPVHQGLTVMGHEVPGLAQLNKLTSAALRVIDKGGRLAANNMYDELVRRGWAKDTPEGRREFINNMGQYNARMMPSYQAAARNTGLSSFVVAGTQMNRNAMRRLLSSPLVQAASPEARAKMRMVEIASLASIMLAFPYAANYILNGNIYGRPGTPSGAIDLGKPKNPDGTHDTFDPLQLFLLRRGRRITGMEAAKRGIDEGLGARKTVGMMARDIFAGIVHPYSGPAARTLFTAATGKDTGGYLLSRNPESQAKNIIAAIKNINPTVAAYLKGKETGKGGSQAFKSLAGALGMKTSRRLSLTEQTEEEAKKRFGKPYEQLSLMQKRAVTRDVQTARKEQPGDELARRQAGARAYWEDFAQTDALLSSLPGDQQDWLRKNKLRLSGFKAELTLGGVKLPPLEADKEFMATAVSEEYQKQIARLVKSESFAALPSVAAKQKRLDQLLTLARERARYRLRRRPTQTPAAESRSPQAPAPSGPDIFDQLSTTGAP